jgi:hypothetical protein
VTNRITPIYTQEGPDMIQPQRIKSALAATLALSAIVASPAAARPAVYTPSSGSSGTTTTCTGVCPGEGLDWGDAAIGAGGAVVILLVGAGGVRAAALRRTRDAGQAEVTAAS